MAKLDEVIGAVIKVRDQIDAIKKEQKEALSPLSLKLEKLEAYLQLQLTTLGVTNFAAKGVGTAYLQNVTGVTVEDWDATLAWIKETELWEMLEKRVSKSVVQDYMESQNNIPPGVKVRTEVEVRIRRG
ncbi:MAG: hypothetical protein ACHQ9S_18950 [Candidatus Binatia bacterium]